MSFRTDRLLLRPWTEAEAATVRAGERHQDWATDFPAEGDVVIAGLLAERPDWLAELGHHLVVERATGEVVGSIGLFWPPEDGVVEIGYGIVPSRRGRRYAAEATVALTRFALSSPQVRSVSAQVERSNPASVRVLEAAGFTCVADDGDVLRFSSPA
ncbi:GNAT family N-acetyltransferase [Amycolatopsis viridis]|uniref:RimJ/RimL family protein N-acetyltransferase n=1 Tax=Amycolatopsis viridis TaxID=185678 RepID=A0ABX0T147_9PSEU|nr:GNAT family N-acetyltransferase [Amycolatopsis viridis]NIH81614.1 RimJ/RimL family protein N-acetyltransferase [Amycolatopsis viridis]